MKTSLLFAVTFAILGLAAPPVIAQTQTSSAGHVQTSKLIGTKVKTAQGEEIGVIKDIVLDRSNGCMAYTVLSTGGTGTRTTGQAKTVAVPWAVYSPTSDLSVLTVSVDRDRIYNAPVFDYTRIDEYASSGYINNIYSYYGVSAQVGVTGQTSVTGGATTAATGATASQTAAASPGATAGGVTRTPSPPATASPRATTSPAGTAAARPYATASESPRGTASPSAYGSATASPSTRGTRGARGKTDVTPSPSGRGETASPSTTEESSAESAASPSSERKKASRKRAAGERTEPSATPQSPKD